MVRVLRFRVRRRRARLHRLLLESEEGGDNSGAKIQATRTIISATSLWSMILMLIEKMTDFLHLLRTGGGHGIPWARRRNSFSKHCPLANHPVLKFSDASGTLQFVRCS